MSDISSYYAELYAEIDRRIRAALHEYRPDLSKASNGALPLPYVPVLGTSKIEDGSITEAKLSFDPATQAELDAEAATRAAADTALAAPSYVTIASSATLANERVITAGTRIGLTDGGAGSTLTIAFTTPLTTRGDLYVRDASADTRLPIGAAARYLRSTGTDPAWASLAWADLTGTPTTLAGYGITDAQPLDSDLTAIAALTTTSYGRGFLTQIDAAGSRTYIDAAATDHTHGVQASGEWTWKAPAQSGDPGTNNAGVDNDAPSSATILYLNKFGPNSVDYSGVFSALRTNDTIYLQQANNAASWHRYDVTGTPTLTGSAYAIPVSTLSGSAQGTEPSNNTRVYIVVNQGASAGGMTGSGTAGQVAYWSSSSAITSESAAFTWDATNDRLGIGTSSPQAPLHVIDNSAEGMWITSGSGHGSSMLSYNGSGADGLFVAANAHYDGSNWQRMATGGVAWLVAYGAPIGDLFQIGRASSGSNPIGSWTNLLTIDSAGKLGVGTSSPATKLHARGAVASFGFYDADALAGTEVDILPTGSAVYVFDDTQHAVRASTGTIQTGGGIPINVPGSSSNTNTIYSDGTNTVTLRVYSTGRVTLQRTAGTATFKVSMIYIAL